ncbi:MAG: acyltransferase [Chitinophagales bacterium]|nr:acyltransferase [Chitinophagales bacterium]
MFIKKYRFDNWKREYPSNLIEYLYTPVGLSLRIVNFIFQKIFRLNGEFKFMVHFTTIVSGKIEIGKGVAQYIAGSSGCYLQGINGIKIGDFTMIAPGVKIISANHNIKKFSEHDYTKPIVIGKKCWLGTNCVILPGVEIGDNVIVGAGSVVTKSFGSNLIIAGNPAMIIRENN